MISPASDEAVHGDARLVPQRRPRGAVRGDRRTATSARSGLDVQPVVPAETAEPLKLLAAGKVDMAISYEPEVLLARDQGLKVVSVAALVQRPLTSIIALPEQHVTSVAEPRRQDRRHRRHPLSGGRAATRSLQHAGVNPATRARK